MGRGSRRLVTNGGVHGVAERGAQWCTPDKAHPRWLCALCPDRGKPLARLHGKADHLHDVLRCSLDDSVLEAQVGYAGCLQYPSEPVHCRPYIEAVGVHRVLRLVR